MGDVDAMAECALRILSNTDCCITLSEAAARRVAERFGYADIVPQYEAVCERVLR